ncbi:helix-turn-helix transcriptional regulator [Gluconobacter cerinus]|nr:helix-turn-helix transcriptional regulator [Gluconobacter cerinus]MBS1022543.1 helix-turn-helix transcriptional regulator [Gluconobacter cerinus]MBS1034279.1 helix-turn-helix transcriptional regulator [Gluconobacter cerinus]MBS1072453.1 helix-turn-helix transcriptional regulator [Gluconobacter cerinus]
MQNLTANQTQSILIENRIDTSGGLGFGFRNPSIAVFYDWHEHPRHQITYARRGTTQIEGPEGRHLLPASHAIWIPAGTRHRTMMRNLDGVSVYFDPAHFSAETLERIQTFPVTAVIKEMLFHTLRWSDKSAEKMPVEQTFFQALFLLCQEQMKQKAAETFTLPRVTHPSLVRAMDSALVDPGHASLTQAWHQAGMSERSFRRHFLNETGMTWQAWITQARLFHAATLLAEGQRVTDVSAEVGYASLSAFAKAFTHLLGQSPVRFRKSQESN